MQPPENGNNINTEKPDISTDSTDSQAGATVINSENTPNHDNLTGYATNSSTLPVSEANASDYTPIPNGTKPIDGQQGFTEFERTSFIAFLGTLASALFFAAVAWFSGAGGIGALMIAMMLLMGLAVITVIIFVTNLLSMIKIKKNAHKIPIKRYFVGLAAISPIILWLTVSSLGAYFHNQQEQQKARNTPVIFMPDSSYDQNLRYREVRVGEESSIYEPYPLSFPDGSNRYEPLVVRMYGSRTLAHLDPSLGFGLIQYSVPENYSIEENCAFRRRTEPPAINCNFVYETSQGHRVYTLGPGIQKAVVIDNILIVVDRAESMDDELLSNLVSKNTSEVFFHKSTFLGRYYGNKANR